MRITFFETGPWDRALFQALDGHEVEFIPGPLKPGNAHLASGSDVVSIAVYSELGEKTLTLLGSLKMVAVRSSGYENVDVSWCLERGIPVSNIPDYGGRTVAEFVMALILTVSRKVADALQRTRHGDLSLRGLKGFDLSGRTMGVIGTGRIGREVIMLSRCFRMKAAAYSRTRYSGLEEEFGFRYMGLNDLLRVSDIVSIHVPATAETRAMLSDEQFNAMKPGAIIVNTSRGEIIDHRALLRALDAGKAGAAILDVLPQEEKMRRDGIAAASGAKESEKMLEMLAVRELMRHKRVLVTPHMAFYTVEAVERIMRSTIDNIVSFIEGRPQNVIRGAA